MNESNGMTVRRLGCAGLEVEADGATLVVDLLEDAGSMAAFVGEPHTPLPSPRGSGAVAALVTHLHSDHADPPAIARAIAPGAPVLRPARATGSGLETAGMQVAETQLEELGLATREMAPWETAELGPFIITAVPAVDGFGDPQVSWVIEAAGRRILHAGDTLFHGSWWLIAGRQGPIDVAFLPVNGPVADLPHRQPASPLPVAMDPRQAATAAHLLGARAAVPIHYDTFHAPPAYAQVHKPAAAFARAGRDAGIPVTVLAEGEEMAIREQIAVAG
jgi:L-ascorbate metabolism protein UlaG (beta-lactamase superfamily)